MMIYKNVKFLVGGYDLSCDVNQLSLEYAFDEVDRSDFCHDAHYGEKGLPKSSYSFQGYQEFGEGKVEEALAALSASEIAAPVTWAPAGAGTPGQVAYFSPGVLFTYSWGAATGEQGQFNVSGSGTDRLIRGTVLERSQKSASGNGDARELGAVSSEQSLYGVLHVLAVEGTDPTLDVVVQSDDASGFASGVTRLTFPQQVQPGAVFLSAAGPITDTYYRAALTIGGEDAAFLIALAVGIL
jgi:hypothetical protein